MRIQVTLYDKSGKYKPVSTLVRVADEKEFKNNREEIKNTGIKKIMNQRGWSKRELIKYNFLTCKMRIYPEENS
mgnify:CR=1 FL=1